MLLLKNTQSKQIFCLLTLHFHIIKQYFSLETFWLYCFSIGFLNYSIGWLYNQLGKEVKTELIVIILTRALYFPDRVSQYFLYTLGYWLASGFKRVFPCAVMNSKLWGKGSIQTLKVIVGGYLILTVSWNIVFIDCKCKCKQFMAKKYSY